ncbi:MAG TPA: AsmA-like C-terminal region-containing protein [Candidatus Angelobacter sp.]
MAVSSRKKTILGIVVALLLGIFLPPNINGKRFKSRLAGTLGNALGRPVKIGSVSFRLLPRPGFDLYDFEVGDDPAFSAEPLLLCGKVTADLRLTSLWQGRLEIANLTLHNESDRVPPSLNLVYFNGHWNVESLLVRAEQIPSAPTVKKRAEQRTRFPYIEAEAGRINVKIGPVKKPYALVNTDFAFWLASEDLWHLRLQGNPVRTDMEISDTGKIKIEGDLKRSADLRQTPVKLQFSWEEGQLGQLSRLTVGQDKGWRGALDIKGELAGALADLRLTAEGNLQDFRRYDIGRRGMFEINTRCQGQYTQGQLNFDCSTPVESGGIRLSGRFPPMTPNEYDLSLVANRVPMSAVARFATFAKRTLPEDLTATGQLDAAFAFHSRAGLPQDWHGTGSTSTFALSSSLISDPIQVGSIRFHLSGPSDDNQEASPPVKKSRGTEKNIDNKTQKKGGPIEAQSLIFDPFSIQMGNGAAFQARGTFRSDGYVLALSGTAPLERALALATVSGFRPRISNAAGLASLDLDIHGPWANFAPTQVSGTAHLQNVIATIAGLKDRLLLQTADVNFSDSEAVLIAAIQFEHSPVQLTGSISNPLNCPSDSGCAAQFDLRADALAAEDVYELLDMERTGWTLPLGPPGAGAPDFRADGSLSLGTLTVGQLALQKFIAHVQVGEHSLVVNNIHTAIADGSMQGEWKIDWSTAPANYSGTGILTAVSPDSVPFPASALLGSWISGKTNLKYSLDMAGADASAMLASARGHAEFTVMNGVSRALNLQSSKPIRFQNLQGQCDINREVLELLPSKFKAEDRIYEISGTISLADKQANLKVSNSATQWEITGTLEKPSVAAQRLTAQQVSVHNQ